jgi:hypothetical protein
MSVVKQLSMTWSTAVRQPEVNSSTSLHCCSPGLLTSAAGGLLVCCELPVTGVSRKHAVNVRAVWAA